VDGGEEMIIEMDDDVIEFGNDEELLVDAARVEGDYQKERKMSEELKACPFCGMGNDLTHMDCGEIQDGELEYFVICSNCGCVGPNDTSPERAAKMWNLRRIEDAQAATIAALERDLASMKNYLAIALDVTPTYPDLQDAKSVGEFVRMKLEQLRDAINQKNVTIALYKNKLIPARSPAQCIDRLRLEKDSLVTALAKLMYWMDKARESQDIDVEEFNKVWFECMKLVSDYSDKPPEPRENKAIDTNHD
jgi:hypothetical protein